MRFTAEVARQLKAEHKARVRSAGFNQPDGSLQINWKAIVAQALAPLASMNKKIF